MSNHSIKVAIADDHKLVRQAIIFGLAGDASISIVLETENAIELIASLPKYNPDIVLLDVKMPGMNGIEALKIIADKYPEVKVIMISAFLDEVFIAQCLEYGIYGYLSKAMGISEIIRAIKEAYENRMYLTNLIENRMVKNYLISFNKKTQNLLPDFSYEELQILNLLKEEKTTQEISVLMNQSKRSIELKRDRMRGKANSKTIGGLLLYALKRGILE
ncbi:MAG TPA: response regulator transcription factor [Puia sp.]|jgi:DNA-binding NarL/FixJ family response regulator|nr:response regulator transcription factor [Puia sp.]